MKIYHSYNEFTAENTDRKSKVFKSKELSIDKSVHLNEFLLVINTGDKPLSFELRTDVPVAKGDGASYLGVSVALILLSIL